MTSPASSQYVFEEVADGVVAAIASPEGSALCNSLIVDLGQETLVFDTGYTPAAALALRAEAIHRFGDRPQLVVNSHKHNDHIRGNQAFPRARIVSTRETRDRIRELVEFDAAAEKREFEGFLQFLEQPRWSETDTRRFRNMALGVIDSLDSLRITPPNMTFERILEVHGTRRLARLRSFGGGHTSSDAFLELPDDGVLALGDLLTIENHPSIEDGKLAEWRRILGEISALRFTHVVPGHGRLGGPTDLPPLLRYFDDLEQEAAHRRRTGASPSPEALAPVPARYAHWAAAMAYGSNLESLLRAGRPASP
ncbi:MAG TPA: MBL fold metallo-hydrolase [Thermoplasmata archaeon]|nr:MBL fold metallo-hydrolase [Thermoplasmata archaeon]